MTHVPLPPFATRVAGVAITHATVPVVVAAAAVAVAIVVVVVASDVTTMAVMTMNAAHERVVPLDTILRARLI